MPMKVLQTLVGAWIMLVWFTGCATLQDKQRMEDFGQTSEAYGKAIFWSQFDLAYAFHRGSRTGEDLPDFERLESYKVVAYNVAGSFPSKDTHRVRQIVEIRYFRNDNMVVKSMRRQLDWVYDEEEERWLIESRFPKFK